MSNLLLSKLPLTSSLQLQPLLTLLLATFLLTPAVFLFLNLPILGTNLG